MKKHILVVDDEETLCEALRFNLEAEGYDVTGDGAKEELSKVLSPSEYQTLLKEHKYKLGFKYLKY